MVAYPPPQKKKRKKKKIYQIVEKKNKYNIFIFNIFIYSYLFNIFAGLKQRKHIT